jgi:hypothetical protein
LKREPGLVKKWPPTTPNAAASRAFRRHLQGYELGLVTLGMVLTFGLLTLPRASVPHHVPLPHIDRAQAQKDHIVDRELFAQAEAEGLPFEVRALGEAIRHFGQSVARGLDTGHDRDDLRERLESVLAKGQAPLLLRLRAVQTQFFLRALAQFEQEAQESSELEELGADFVSQAKRNGWFASNGQCLADEATRRVLFRMHWADLIERRATFPFAPSLNEWRIYYRFLLLHPGREPGITKAFADDAARLRVVNALAKKDPEYPSSFARGTLLYGLGDQAGARASFRAQLGQHESGAYALLARNYLIGTLQGVL